MYTPNPKLTEVLLRLQQEHHLTQRELGSRLGLSGSSMSSLVNGNRKLDFSVIKILVNEFKVSPDELMEFTPKAKSLLAGVLFKDTPANYEPIKQNLFLLVFPEYTKLDSMQVVRVSKPKLKLKTGEVGKETRMVHAFWWKKIRISFLHLRAPHSNVESLLELARICAPIHCRLYFLNGEGYAVGQYDIRGQVVGVILAGGDYAKQEVSVHELILRPTTLTWVPEPGDALPPEFIPVPA